MPPPPPLRRRRLVRNEIRIGAPWVGAADLDVQVLGPRPIKPPVLHRVVGHRPALPMRARDRHQAPNPPTLHARLRRILQAIQSNPARRAPTPIGPRKTVPAHPNLCRATAHIRPAKRVAAEMPVAAIGRQALVGPAMDPVMLRAPVDPGGPRAQQKTGADPALSTDPATRGIAIGIKATRAVASLVDPLRVRAAVEMKSARLVQDRPQTIGAARGTGRSGIRISTPKQTPLGRTLPTSAAPRRSG